MNAVKNCNILRLRLSRSSSAEHVETGWFLAPLQNGGPSPVAAGVAFFIHKVQEVETDITTVWTS